jgi:flagella basal body P-ring formation protein FlgA
MVWPGLVFACSLEIMNTVKTSTPMKPSMQMLCRLGDRLTVRGLWLGLALWLSGFPAMSAPLEASTSGAQALHKAVIDWVAQTQSVLPETVDIAPMDPRIQIKNCSQTLAMDLPFASAQTVRVRCPKPAWQLYVRITISGQTARPATPAPSQVAALAPEQRQVLVAAVPLQRGMQLSASHVRLAEVDTPGVPVNVLEHVTQVLYAEVVRDVRPDTPLRSQDIRPTVLVKKGQMVLMSVGQASGFKISARVEAMQDGRYGEQIKLKNRESGRLLTGLVKAPNEVEGL